MVDVYVDSLGVYNMANNKKLDPVKEQKRLKEAYEQLVLNLLNKKLSVYRKKLTKEERIIMLEQVYDTALVSIVEKIMQGEVKASHQMSFVIERARQELEALQKYHDGVKASEHFAIEFMRSEDEDNPTVEA
jgi:hypothetical protein